ncbi:MAG: glycosyltransferase [Anaerolineae bacterium]
MNAHYPPPEVAVIATVYNEGANIDYLMQSLCAQTLPPSEVVIVDGGSADDTVARMQAYADRLPLRVIVERGANISRGRNIALAHTQAEIIAITDAGVRLPDTWLEDITAPLRADPSLTVVGGFFRADPHTTFEAAMGATVLPLAHEVNPQTFLPSSRSVAVRRSAARAVGGYPEWLDYCEDLIFDLRLKATQPPFAFAPAATVAFRPRGSLRAFWTQYYRYARGDGKADLWRKRHAIRYGVYLVALPLLLVGGAVVHPMLWGLLAAGGLAYCWPAWRRLPVVMQHAPDRSAAAWAQAIALVPIIRAVGDLAKMTGYPVGLWWRRQHRPPSWQL